MESTLSESMTQDGVTGMASIVRKSVAHPSLANSVLVTSETQNNSSDWRLDLIKKNIREPAKVTTDNETVLISSQSLNGEFCYSEKTNCDRLFRLETNAESVSDGSVIRWSPITKDLTGTNRFETTHSGVIKLETETFCLTRNDGQILNMELLLRNIIGERSKSLKFAHIFEISDFSLYNDDQNEIFLKVPVTIEDIFTTFHEIGHFIHPVVSSDEMKKARSRALLYHQPPHKLKPNEVNPDLELISNDEVMAWESAFEILDALRNEGFVKFDDDRFFGLAKAKLKTYEDETINVPGKRTPGKLFTLRKPMRKNT